MILIAFFLYLIIVLICFRTVYKNGKEISTNFKIGIAFLSSLMTFLVFFYFQDFINFITVVWLDLIFKFILVLLMPYIVTYLIVSIIRKLFY